MNIIRMNFAYLCNNYRYKVKKLNSIHHRYTYRAPICNKYDKVHPRERTKFSVSMRNFRLIFLYNI